MRITVGCCTGLLVTTHRPALKKIDEKSRHFRFDGGSRAGEGGHWPGLNLIKTGFVFLFHGGFPDSFMEAQRVGGWLASSGEGSGGNGKKPAPPLAGRG
jgi:hypothetical protein